LGIGRFLAKDKKLGEKFPKKTQVRLISFAGEEAGLRGAKRYLKRHKEQLKRNNVKMVNMDSIAESGKVIFVDKEPLIGAKHDPEIYLKLSKIAKDMGLEAKIGSLPFGATDAAAFSKGGVSATTISDLDLEDELAPYYHTREDTPEVIDKEALGQVVQICVEYIKYIDSKD
jgi:Zn-dependent M28 family amino/carboxypeptidase